MLSKNIIFLISFITFVSASCVCYLGFSKRLFKNKVISIKVLYVEEYLVSFTVSLWIFILFELKLGLLLWFIAYVIINIVFLTNLKIKVLFFNKGNEKIKKTIIYDNLFNTKKEIVNKTPTFKVKPKNIYNILKYRTSYCIGILIATIVIILKKYLIQVNYNVSSFDALLENLTLLTTILCYVYKITYILFVKNIFSKWFNDKVWFNIFFTLYAIVCYIIVFTISFS